MGIFMYIVDEIESTSVIDNTPNYGAANCETMP